MHKHNKSLRIVFCLTTALITRVCKIINYMNVSEVEQMNFICGCVLSVGLQCFKNYGLRLVSRTTVSPEQY